MALALDGGDGQAMQPLIGQGQWQEEAWLHQHWGLVDETRGEADGVCIVDGSDVPMRGAHAVGVARQWCGRLGTVDNGPAGVCTASASRQGDTRLARRRYLPEAWFDAVHRTRWKPCGIPDETAFTPKPALALELLRGLVAEGTLRFQWVTGAEACGRETAFWDGVAALPRWYDAEVPHDTAVWRTRPTTAVPPWSGRGRRPSKARLVPTAPGPPRVDPLAAGLPPSPWQPFRMQAGSQGPVVAECACPRGVAGRAGRPGPDGWMVWRRALGAEPELKVSLSHAPADTPLAALVRMAGMRWPIETALEASKGGVGLDHDEVRSWRGWPHQMTLCFLAQHFLGRTRRRLKKGRQR